MEESTKNTLKELSKCYSQATGNFSKVSRTWAFSIIIPILTFYLEEKSLDIWTIVIISFSVVSILLDGIQYFYDAMKTKRLIDDVIECKLTSDEINKKNEKIYNRLFSIIIAKFSILVANTILLVIFLIIKAF